MSDQLYAWVTDLPDGELNIVGALLPGVGTVPLVFASERVARLLQPMAAVHARSHSQPVRLVRFAAQDVLERISP